MRATGKAAAWDEKAVVEDVPAAGVGEDLEVATKKRPLGGFWLVVVQCLGFVFALYYLTAGYVGGQSPQFHRAFFLLGTAVLVFLVYATSKRERPRRYVPVWDVALALASAASFGYFILNFAELGSRVGAPNQVDTIMGGIAVLVSLELTRRTTGWMLTSVGIVSILYVFFGEYAPGLLQHGGFSVERAIGMAYQSFNGIFGVVTTAFANFVFLFIIFGTFLAKSGAARFFADVPFAIAGHKRGGPAKVSVLMSGIMGSVSGSAVSNVMTTGVFTIPAMLRTGYRREFAGGVEAASSTGGGILPPVMGTGAFIIAEFSGVPYRDIVLVSIVPALLYFAAVYYQVHLEALKHGIGGLKKSELPSLKTVLKEGWYFATPLIVIFTLILTGSSPAFAGFWGTVATVVVGLVPYKGKRMTLKDIFDAMWESSVNVLPVAAIAGMLGIVVAAVNLTGLGLRFSDVVIDASGGYLFVLMILLIIAAWVLGAGLTVTSAYVILAILAVPALQEFGVPLLVAHLVIFWISQDVTPPVCVPAFAAASIAGGHMMKTGYEAWKLARGLYIVPFLMVYGQLIDGSLGTVIQTALFGLVGTLLFAAASTGYALARLSVPLRLVVLAGSVLCIAPGLLSHSIGVGIGVLVYGFQWVVTRRLGKEPAQPVDTPPPGPDAGPTEDLSPAVVADGQNTVTDRKDEVAAAPDDDKKGPGDSDGAAGGDRSQRPSSSTAG